PYRASLERRDRGLGRLESLAHDDPEERNLVEALAGPLGREREEMDGVVRRRGAGDFEAARARVMKGAGQEGLDEVVRVTAALKTAEQKGLGRRQDEAAITADETRGTIVVGHGLLLVVLSLGGVALYGEARGRRLGEERYR